MQPSDLVVYVVFLFYLFIFLYVAFLNGMSWFCFTYVRRKLLANLFTD